MNTNSVRNLSRKVSRECLRRRISLSQCSRVIGGTGPAPVVVGVQPTTARAFSSSSNEATTSTTSSRYAVVDHSYAYEQSMKGQHGQQLALAELEGIGKDDPPFDPFLEEELEEERLRQAATIDEGEVLGEEESVEEDGETIQAQEDDEGGFEGEDDEDYYDDEDEEYIEGDETNIFQKMYNNDGSLRRTKSELATLRAGAPAGGMFAILELAGSQFKVTTDDVLVVNKLKPVDKYSVGSVHTFKDNIMLLSSSHKTFVGMPYLTSGSGAEIDVMVEEITKDAKVVVFKKRRRKNSKRKKGFRRDVTMLRILDIRPPTEYADHYHVERRMPDTDTDAVIAAPIENQDYTAA